MPKVPRRSPRAFVAALALAALGCAHTAEDVPQLKREARADFEAGHSGDAIETMQEVVALAPEDAEAHFLLGVMLLRTDYLTDAETELARAVALAPRNGKMLAAHGLALRAQKRWSEAENAFVRSLLFEPGEPSTIAALGELYRLSGKPDQCAVRYEQFAWQLEQREQDSLTESERRALATARERVRECQTAAEGQAAARPLRP
jgi:Flp pilus assembly protein TadD